jgi:ribonucleotide monophosphatase NagD (HAD superfamily)
LEIIQFGKPEKIQYQYAHDILLKNSGYDHFDVIYGVGDNPEADIKGANNAGYPFQSVLVRSGIFNGENDKINPSLHVFDNIGDFIKNIGF